MKDDIFPPGDIQSNKKENGNLWRETSFALKLISQAINPRLGLQSSLENWYEIQKKLSENTRKRKKQIEKITLLS